MAYLTRLLEAKILEYTTIFPVVGLTGPRQSGKSTMLLNLFKDRYTYVSFDDQRIVQFFEDDPEKFMMTYANHVIFDEVQKAPELFNYIKLAVDRDRQQYGKYILTGSSQFSMMKHITESLAGRMGLLTLLPFQYTEMPNQFRAESVFRGAYPEPTLNSYQHANAWYSAYISTYLDKDVRTLHNVGDLRDFRRLLSLLAANTAQILNMSRFANDLGVTVATIKRWISILEASYIVFLLPPYYKNYGKRIVKSPKLYFYDTGLVSYLTGIENINLFEKGPMAGSIFENYVISEIAKREIHRKTDANLYYYRTSNGVEIDLLIDRKQYKELIEIKFGATFKSSMIEPIKIIFEKGDQGYLLYAGEAFPYAGEIKILNYQHYLT